MKRFRGYGLFLCSAVFGLLIGCSPEEDDGTSSTTTTSTSIQVSGPTMAILSPADGFSTNWGDFTVVLSSSSDDGVTSNYISVSSGSDSFYLTTFVSNAFSDMPDGSYTVKAYAVDADNNVSLTDTVSVTVDSPSVYICGQYTALNGFFYDDGNLVNLVESNSVDTVVNDMTYSAGKFYICGTHNYHAAYWLDNDLHEITNVSTDGQSIWIDGVSVIVGGSIFFNSTNRAAYWVDDTIHILTNVNSSVNAVTVNSGGNILSAGTYYRDDSFDCAACWVDETIQPLTNVASRAKDITVSGTDVYICGEVKLDDGYFHACYWKNGDIHILDSNSIGSVALAIVVKNNTVYTLGFTDSTPYYWVDGTPTASRTLRDTFTGSMSMTVTSMFAAPTSTIT